MNRHDKNTGGSSRSALITGIAVVYVLALSAFVIAADLGLMRPVMLWVGKIPWGDKLAHFLLVGTLSLLVNLASGAATLSLGRVRVLIGSLALVVLATLEESTQLAVRFRTFSFSDLAANYLGIIVFGQVAARLVRGRNRAD